MATRTKKQPVAEKPAPTEPVVSIETKGNDWSSHYDAAGYLTQNTDDYTAMSICRTEDGRYVIRQIDVIDNVIVKTHDSEKTDFQMALARFKSTFNAFNHNR